MTTPWEKYNCKVIGEAENGLAGIELISRLKPDIVFTDIRMSGLNGLAMIQKAQEFVDSEFVIISGYNEFDYAKKAIALGVREYLLKPIDDLELEKVLERLVREIGKKERLKHLYKEIQTVDNNKLLYFREYYSSPSGEAQDNYVSSAVKYIMGNYQKDIGIKEVSEYLHISESYLSRLFKNETNYTFIEYLTYFRLKKALELLRDKKCKIYEIAHLVGYGDARYFSKLFKSYLGITPREFRDRLS